MSSCSKMDDALQYFAEKEPSKELPKKNEPSEPVVSAAPTASSSTTTGWASVSSWLSQSVTMKNLTEQVKGNSYTILVYYMFFLASQRHLSMLARMISRNSMML